RLAGETFAGYLPGYLNSSALLIIRNAPCSPKVSTGLPVLASTAYTVSLLGEYTLPSPYAGPRRPPVCDGGTSVVHSVAPVAAPSATTFEPSPRYITPATTNGVCWATPG